MSPQHPTSGTGTTAPLPDDPDDPDGVDEPTPRPTAARPSRWWGITGGVVAAVAVLVFAWATVRSSDQGVTATTVGYKVVDDRSVTVSFDVTRPLTQPVTCTIEAQASDFSVVGTAQVVIATGTARTTHHEGTVRTTSRAVTGNVTDCVRT